MVTSNCCCCCCCCDKYSTHHQEKCIAKIRNVDFKMFIFKFFMCFSLHKSSLIHLVCRINSRFTKQKTPLDMLCLKSLHSQSPLFLSHHPRPRAPGLHFSVQYHSSFVDLNRQWHQRRQNRKSICRLTFRLDQGREAG